MKAIKLSVLDLCPILSGQDAAHSFRNMVDLARFTEALGFHRYWMAEHHDMAGIGSSAPEVLISHVSQATKKIRVGSGGIMLPNHAALHIAEIFRTLEALYPHRIDLGVGRAPGTGSVATSALRGAKGPGAFEFSEQVDELQSWLNDSFPREHPYHGVRAQPLVATPPELWILGSSDFGASLAAQKGLPYAFAQHFSEFPALEVLHHYRQTFRSSPWLKEPVAMLGTHIICAETDDKARELALSSELSFALFIKTGKSIPLPTVKEAKAMALTKEDWLKIRATSRPKFVGSPSTVKKAIKPFIDSGLVDELMITSMVHDQEARRKSYEFIADMF